MPTTADALAACHDRADVRYSRDDERGVIESMHKGYNGSYRIVARLELGGDLFTLTVPGLDVVTARNRQRCLEALLAINYNLVLGRYGCDLRDGEVSFRAALLVADGTLTQAQFEHLFFAALRACLKNTGPSVSV